MYIRKRIAGLLGASLLVSVPFIYDRVSVGETKFQWEPVQEAKKSKALTYNDLVVLISHSLMETGYGLSLSDKECSDHRYLLHVKLPRYHVPKKIREELLQKIEGVIAEHNFDRQDFLIKITSYIELAEQSSPKKAQELDTFYNELNQDDGFFDQIGKDLDQAGYSYEAGYSIVGVVYSPNKISLDIISEHEEVTSQTRVEINRIFDSQITNCKLTSVEFLVNAININVP